MIKYDNLSSHPYGTHAKVIKLIGKDKRVLDVGCTTGYIARELKAHGCTVVGIEYDSEAAKEASKVCANVYVGDALKVIDEVSPGDFDYILLADVLEHLVDPKSLLIKSQPLLASNGSIIISVPNIAHWKIRLKLLFGRFEYEKMGILDETHLRFFTLKSILRLVKNAGYDINHVDVTAYGGFPNFPIWRSTRVAHKLAYLLARILKGFLAYQFIIKANPSPQNSRTSPGKTWNGK